MKVYVNNKPVEIIHGMSVKHALINAEILKEGILIKSITDEWGNEIGMDGELSEGYRIFVNIEIQ